MEQIGTNNLNTELELLRNTYIRKLKAPGKTRIECEKFNESSLNPL